MQHTGQVVKASRLTRRRGLRRVTTIIVVAVSAALVAGVAILAVSSRLPLLPGVESARSLDAIELWELGRYEEVVTVTDEHLAQYPMDATALTLRGFARFYLGMREVETDARQTYLIGTIQDLRRALLLPPGSLEAETHYVLGKAYFHRGRFYYDSAINQLLTAESEGMRRLDMYEYLALAHRDLAEPEAAVGYFTTAIRIGDEAVHKITLADLQIERGEYSAADALLNDVISRTNDPTLSQHALLSLGRSLRRQERFDAAAATYRELLEVNPASAEAHFGLGELNLARGENELARFHWREAVRLDPNHIESLRRLQEY